MTESTETAEAHFPAGAAPTEPGVLDSPTLASQSPPPQPSRRSGPSLGEEAAEAAERFLKHRPRGARDDCSGFVIAAYDAAGLTLSGSAQSLWELAQNRGEVHRRKRPNVGDLAYFDNTYDRNKNGRLDDRLTHIAIVLEVDKDGTVTLAHNGTSAGRTTMVMNLHEPNVHIADSGKVMNTYLRSLSSRPKNAKRLSGDLWRGFSTPQPDRLARND